MLIISPAGKEILGNETRAGQVSIVYYSFIRIIYDISLLNNDIYYGKSFPNFKVDSLFRYVQDFLYIKYTKCQYLALSRSQLYHLFRFFKSP